jgi:PAS domain S-box-containing protein
MTSPEPTPARILDAIGHSVIVSVGGAVLTWNRGAELLYGWTADEAIGRSLLELTASASTPEDNTRVMEVVRGGEPWSGDFPVRRKDGTVFLVHATVAAVRDDDGEIEAVVSVSHDVSARHNREVALEEADERLRTVFESARMGTWSWDADTDFVEWDEQMEACYGLGPGEFEGTLAAYVERLHPDDRDSVLATIADARAARDDFEFEHRVVWPDGTVHWLEARGRVVRDDDGEFVGMVGVGIDIDERKEIDALILEASELRATATLAADLAEAERIARLGSWRWERGTNVVTLSAQMARVLDCERTMSGVEFAEKLQLAAHPDDAPVLTRAATEALGARQPRYLMECRLVVGGEVREMVHRGEIVLDDDDNTIRVVRGTFQDVTDQRRAERALLATRERLAMERRAVDVLRDTLLHPDFPGLAGFSVAARYVAAENDLEIGGDWYDAFLLPDGRLLVTVGDVSGHGVDASRLMAKIRHATRAYACIEDDLGVLVQRLDGFVTQFATEGQIATTLVARVDPQTGKFDVVSAGHLPALLVRAGDAEFVEQPQGQLLGAPTARDTLTPSRGTIEAGESLLLFTDGLVERRAEHLDAGLERLRFGLAQSGGLEADALCDAAIDVCLAGRTRGDDVCILALHRA